MEVKFFNSMGRKIQEFIPINEKKASIYACGLTVYDYAHTGNLRTYVFVDILRRILEYAGYSVNHVMNITDVGHLTDDADQGEDKMIKGARESDKTVWEIAEYYTKIFLNDLEQLNIKLPTTICKATEHIKEMIDLIQRLEEKGYTYISGGNVYFDISKFKDYGKLALLDLEDLQAGSRVKIDKNKKNPFDFALWFTKSKFEHQVMLWDSPWGCGYPGWHIECSAMAIKYLGEKIDIHCGGIDHIPVHHTNEIAQSEAALGKKWVNYWLHGEFLVRGRIKMSKSKGNFLTISDLEEKGYKPLDYRYYLLGAHYRSQLEFSLEAFNGAKTAFKKLKDRILNLKEALSIDGAPTGDVEDFEIKGKALDYLSSFESNAFNDMNMPRCLSDLWGIIRDDEIDASAKLNVIFRMDSILGLGLKELKKNETLLDNEINVLIEQRNKARETRDFAKADEIRDLLLKKNIVLEDTPGGVRWKKI